MSQGVYLCTGSHDWSRPTFDLVTRPIEIKDGAWVAASCVVGPGITIGTGAVLLLGSVATKDLEPWQVYRGNPAEKLRTRKLATAGTGSDALSPLAGS